MKITYSLLLILLFTACQEDTPAADTAKQDKPQDEEVTVVNKNNHISPTNNEEQDYTPPASLGYEVDPMAYPLVGTIDGDTIYMQLDFLTNKIEGKYMYKRYMKPIQLEGYYIYYGFILNEFDENGNVTAYFRANGSYRDFYGHWFKTDQLNNGSAQLALMDSYGVYLEPTGQFTALGQEGSSEYALEFGLALGCDDCTSFRSIDKPNEYLRHQSFQIKQHAYNDCRDHLYRKDASFRMLHGLASDTTVSFQSFNYPNHYIFYNTVSQRFAMKEKSKMTPQEKVKASFVLQKHKADTGGLAFSMKTQINEGLEDRPFVAGRIYKEAYKFVSFDVGDGSPYYDFKDQNGDDFYFQGNYDKDIELGVLVPEGEADETNQGWMSNPQYVGTWFEIEYSKQYTFTSFNMADYEDVFVIRSLKKL